MSNVRTVAREAQVSVATVSRVLSGNGPVSESKRSKVLSAANRLGYFASQQQVESVNIGVVYFGTPSVQSPFDAALWEGLSQAMGEIPFNLVAVNALRIRRPGQSYSEALRRAGIRAAVLRSVQSTEHETAQMLAEGFPCVLISDRDAEGDASRVFSDSKPASRSGIEHLIELGHTRIAVGGSDMADSDHTDRLSAYREVMDERGFPVAERDIIHVPPDIGGGAQLLRRIMSMRNRPTAVYVIDPLVAVGLINHAHELGVPIPEQLSVIGFDDSALRNMVYPRMTAICQDARQLGYEAFLMLSRVIQNQDHPVETRELSTWFEIHSSTSQPPVSPIRVMPDNTRVEDDKEAFSAN